MLSADNFSTQTVITLPAVSGLLADCHCPHYIPRIQFPQPQAQINIFLRHTLFALLVTPVDWLASLGSDYFDFQ
jgi:hypothetical protein